MTLYARIANSLGLRLERAARQNERSVAAEVRYRLIASLDADERLALAQVERGVTLPA